MRSASLYSIPRLDEVLRSAQRPEFQGAGLVGRILTIELAMRATDANLDG